ILRRDYKGLEGGGGIGRSASHKNDYNASLTAGYGDLGSNKFNVFGVFDYYKRQFVALSDTPENGSRDLRYKAGGRNFTSLTGGGTWQQFLPTGPGGALAAQQVYQASASCKGTIINGQQAADAGLINLTGATPTSNATLQARPSNTFCSENFNNEFTAIPSTERYGFLGRGQYEFAPTMTGFVEIGLSRVNTGQTFQDPFFAGTTGLATTSAGLRPFTYNVNFAPGVAGNPFASTARYVGVLGDLGTRDTTVKSDTGRFVGGLLYSFFGWDFDSAVGYSRNKVTANFFNRLTLAGVSSAFNVPTTPQPPVPTSTSSSYNLNNFTLNSDAARNTLRAAPFSRVSTSELEFIDTKASTELAWLKLPGGPVGVAVGGEYRRESLNDVPSAIATTGGILGQGITATDGSRRSEAAFVEFRLPIFKNLESQLAQRFDHYSDYGSSYTPKIGFKYTPISTVALRANYGRGFRAPSLPEISPSVATFFTSVTDPQTGLGTQVSGVFSGNPTLKPEKSHSFNLGIVFEPVKEFSTSFDFYKIDYKDVVASPSFQSYVNASCAQSPTGAAIPPCTNTANVQRDPTTNAVVTVISNYQNLAARSTNGFDLDMRYSFPTTSFGKFGARATGTYIRTFKEGGINYVGTNFGFNTYPRIKAALSTDWDYGPIKVTARGNYTQGWATGAVGSFFTAQDPRFQNGVLPNKTADYVTLDVFGSYAITKNFTLSGSILNAFNRHPPYDPGFSTTYFYDFSQFSVEGRKVRLNVNYKY
ncbi:MAG: TonB-dependent receptor, partial [Pseudomonadota bacterium]|nr:TonB-dependent receptor [Pseudomonadota bacterium]